MANYRTKSLFHYTKNKKSLLEIIKLGVLYPNFCEEDLSTECNPNYILGIPQVCFCDIPISLADNMKKFYKPYAIAFTKKWGIENGCNPIQYVSNESVINSAIHYWERMEELHKRDNNDVILKGSIMPVIKFLYDRIAYTYSIGFMKKHIGKWRNKDYCNYDENEWRYIVPDGEDGIKWKTEAEYTQWRWEKDNPTEEEKKRIRKPIPTPELKRKGLIFTPNDITHIILKKESDVVTFCKDIMKTTSFSEEDKSLLLTKITSFERISQDY